MFLYRERARSARGGVLDRDLERRRLCFFFLYFFVLPNRSRLEVETPEKHW